MLSVIWIGFLCVDMCVYVDVCRDMLWVFEFGCEAERSVEDGRLGLCLFWLQIVCLWLVFDLMLINAKLTEFSI